MSERLDTAARKLIKLREDHERKDAAAKKAKAAREEQEAIFSDLMDDLNHKSTGWLDLGEPYGVVNLIKPKPTIYARVIDKDVALESVKAAGRLEEMFDRAIRKAPANQWIRECLERGEELPDGFDFSDSSHIRIERKK